MTWHTFLSIPVLSIAIPVVVAFITAYLTIKFGPDRKEVSRLRTLVESFASEQTKDKKLKHFQCDVSVKDLLEEGSKVTISGNMPFKLSRVEMANEAGAPFDKVDGDGQIKSEHICVIPRKAINEVFHSSRSGSVRNGALIIWAEIEGTLVDRKKGVVLVSHSILKPPNNTYFSYIKMGD